MRIPVQPPSRQFIIGDNPYYRDNRATHVVRIPPSPQKTMIVQIYEVQNPEEAKKLIEVGVDFIGVLVGKEVDPRGLDDDRVKEIFNSLPSETTKVALTLSSDLRRISELVEKVNPDILQLGISTESLLPDSVKKIKEKYPQIKIMRTIPVIDEKSVGLAKKYEGIADFLILDSRKKGDFQIGATGETHNWTISKKIVNSVSMPVILAGGLGPENVEAAIKEVMPAGVDSKTKTDLPDGNGKDIEKVKEFVRIAKSF